MPDPRRAFGPVVLVGLAAAALAAVAGAQDWVVPDPSAGSASPTPETTYEFSDTQAQGSPLATALALVVLAAWGVVLVTRGRFRRAVAGLGALAGLGLAVTTVAAPATLRADLNDNDSDVAGVVVIDIPMILTGWWWTGLLAALLVVLTTVLAVWLVPRWPEMGTRYDAPADAAEARRRTPETNIDLWKALDEGRDPTA